MTPEKTKYLKKLAKKAGYKSVEEYILAAEMLNTVKKLDRDFERAVILPDPKVSWCDLAAKIEGTDR